jgi:hypothetical protein
MARDSYRLLKNNRIPLTGLNHLGVVAAELLIRVTQMLEGLSYGVRPATARPQR